MIHNLPSLILFRALMVWAVSANLLSPHGISRVAVALVGGFVAVSIGEGASAGFILDGLSCGLSVLGIGFCLFCLGWVSSADAKITAAIATWIGWSNLLVFGAGILAIGLAVWPVQSWWRSRPLPEKLAGIGWLEQLHARKSLPFGLAAAFMAAILYPGAPSWIVSLLGS